MSKFVSAIGAGLLLIPFPNETQAAEPERAAPPGWLIGVGYISARNPYVDEVDTVAEAIPLVGYIGERLTWLGPYVRYELVQDPMVVAAVVEARFEGIPEDVVDGPLAGIQARKPSVEAGPDVAYGSFIASARADVSGRHDGYELSVGLQKKREFGGAWSLEGRIAAVWQSADLNSYLYGVDASEAKPGLDVYVPEGALNYEATLFATYQISRHWLALGTVGLRHLDDEISASPLVDGENDIGGFVGVAYGFGRP